MRQNAFGQKFDTTQNLNPWPNWYKIWYSWVRPRDDVLCQIVVQIRRWGASCQLQSVICSTKKIWWTLVH